MLGTLADGPTYGYAIGQRLAEAGLGNVRGGTLYPLLARLEAEALVESSWHAGDGGPGRKYFTLTAAGGAELANRATLWRLFVDATRRVLPLPDTEPQEAR